MADPQLAAICNKVLRAAIAAKISEREGLDLASKVKPEMRTYLSLVQFDLLGYPMGDSLLPLIQMSRPSGDDEQPNEGITWLDQQIDDTKADLHDRLLNLSPQFGLEISLLPHANPVLNQVYDSALKEAKFAGAIEDTSSEVAQARELLFPEDEDGVSRESEAYRLYKSFDDDLAELDLLIAQAIDAGNTTEARRLQSRQERKQAEWIVLGKKREIEAAIRLISKADPEAGFEDERLRFQDMLDRRKVSRLVSAKDYARVDLRPLEPLIDPDEPHHWRTINISGNDIVDLCTIRIRHIFGLDLKDVEVASQEVVAFEAEVATVMLSREWLSEEFLSAKYWRLDGDPLSNGNGEGLMPTQATRAVFVRNASYRIDGELSAKQRQSKADAGAVNLVPLFRKIDTPLMAKLTTVEEGVVSSQAKAKASVLAQSKLTAKQLGKFNNLLKLKNPVKEQGNPLRLKIGARTRRGRFKAVGRLKGSAQPELVAKVGVAASINSSALLQPGLRRKNKKRPPNLAVPKVLHAGTAQIAGATKLNSPMVLRGFENQAASKRGGKNSSVIRNGTISTSPMVESDDFRVSYQRRANGNDLGPETVVAHTKDGENKYRFSVTVTRGFVVNRSVKQLSEVVLKLRGQGGEVLDEIIIPFNGQASGHPVVWSISRDVSVLEMTAPIHPVLFGYALQINPRAPNPDPNLNWEDS